LRQFQLSSTHFGKPMSKFIFTLKKLSIPQSSHIVSAVMPVHRSQGAVCELYSAANDLVGGCIVVTKELPWRTNNIKMPGRSSSSTEGK
jgi:hypothetical protein